MYFDNVRQKKNALVLAFTFVLAIVVFFVFNTENSSANSIADQYQPVNKVRLQNWRREKIDGKREIARFDFSKTTLPLEPQKTNAKNLLEVLAEGDLDTSFGINGKLTTQIGSSNSQALAVALQSDGEFIAAGNSFNGSNTDFALARYTVNGTLDPTFGNGGKVTTDFGGTDNEVLAIAIQPSDNKIIAGGNTFNNTGDDFALVRYKTDGTLDTTFGSGGIVTTDFGNSSEYIEAIAIQPDGKIVVAGDRLLNSVFRFALARYNSDGTLDQTFGTGGMVTTSFTQFDDLARSIALQSDGKIVVAGEANGDFAVARFNSDGTLDTTFDGDGKVTTSVNIYDSAYAVAIQTDGKIVAAGEAGDGNNADFALVRYQQNGSLDTTFNTSGVVTTAIGAYDEFATSLAIQPSGKIITGGFSFNGSNDDFALIRYNQNGSLDSSFGSGGKLTTDFGSSSFDTVSALTLQSSNRIIAVGTANSRFAAAAYSLGSGCSYSLTPPSQDFPAGGGSSSFTINAGAGCPRSATSNVPWIIITNDPTGTGSGVVNFIVGSDTSSPRTGTISTSGGLNFTVSQVGGSKSRKRTRFF